MSQIQSSGPPAVAWWNDPAKRGYAYQAVLLLILGFLVAEAVNNASTNMRSRGIPTDFSFWNKTSGFDVNLTLIEYSAAASTYGRAFWVGLLNTLLVASISIVVATVVGFVVGIARLSSNWIVARLATVYVETLRNIPLLLQLLFWYNAVLKPLPNPRDSIAVPAMSLAAPSVLSTVVCLAIAVAGWLVVRASKSAAGLTPLFSNAAGSLLIAVGAFGWLFGAPSFTDLSSDGVVRFAGNAGVYLNNRGLIFPEMQYGPGAWAILAALAVALVAAFVYRSRARTLQKQTGEQRPVMWVALGLIVGLPLLAFFIAGRPITLTYPELRGFNFNGGTRILPEFAALMFGLSLYTASFIAEVVRGGILAVAHGQTEAASALGLRRSQALNLIIIPQAMRVVIPPLTNQYLNLIKNSSLAVFIGYPDLVQVFAGTVLNQTGAAVQVIAITMAVYLVISLVTAVAMDMFNKRMSLAER